MRVLIAEDHGIVRQGLRSLLEKLTDVEVVGEAENGQAAVDLAEKFSPDVVIMDVTMPGLNGVEATRIICDRNPDIKVIALSMHADQHVVRGVLDAGACGYVLKSNLFEELERALESIAEGEHYLSPKITGAVIEDYKRAIDSEKKSDTARLTPREQRILQLVAEGKTTKQIARILNISPKTADANRRQIMNKLGISSIAGLTKYAIRLGLTSAEF